MGNKESILSKEEVEELANSTPFSAREISELLLRYQQVVSRNDQKEVKGLSLDQLFAMTEFCGNQYLRLFCSKFLDESNTVIPPYKYIQLCALLSPRTTSQYKRSVLYENLNINKTESLSYEEIFRLLKNLFDHNLSDDHILHLADQILNDPSLTNQGEVTMKELDKIITDNEISHRLTIVFHFKGS